MLDTVGTGAVLLVICALLFVALRRSFSLPGVQATAPQTVSLPAAPQMQARDGRTYGDQPATDAADARTENRNRALEAGVREQLGDIESTRYLARYEVAVSQGRATLVGHVRSRSVARGMVEAAGRVRGISSVDEHMVADDELERRVASAIGRSALNRWSRLVVRADFGHVRIGGRYTSPEARTEALRVGATVPGVVGATAAWATDLIA